MQNGRNVIFSGNGGQNGNNASFTGGWLHVSPPPTAAELLSLSAGDGSHLPHPGLHLSCLNLGKRNYFEDASTVVERHVMDFSSVGKGVKPTDCGGGGHIVNFTAMPRCQVEGCHVALLNAKEYHKRRKVCETQSKAPSVVV